MTTSERTHINPSGPDALLKMLRGYESLWLLALTNGPILVTWLLLFWGTHTTEGFVWATLTEVTAAVVYAMMGWEPWNMALVRLGGGRRIADSEQNLLQRALVRFFRSASNRVLQVLVIAAGAVVPWLIVAVSTLAHGKPFIERNAPIPFIGMCIVGFVDAARGRWLSMALLAARAERRWDLLRDLAG